MSSNIVGSKLSISKSEKIPAYRVYILVGEADSKIVNKIKIKKISECNMCQKNKIRYC